MGWWPFGKGNENTQSIENATSGQQHTETDKRDDLVLKQPIFLDEVSGKFPESPQTRPPNGAEEQFSTSKEVKRFISTLKPEQFYLSNLVTIPCFREAGLSGFTCFFVFSSVLFVYHKNLRKSVNWGFGGLLLGSIFGWEHCNNQRRNSLMAVKLAQERFEKNHRERKE
ncbi:hypothetical protein CAS74_003175 [Pichia kudriavzevii]|uniref:Cytochrome c oxidase assembly protein COX20, mitochondrial n=1 Tax=Pichia kudriavzevii TaxID=4909 RepID=A0A1V2LV62_PICKU|nr:uncharacterized protein C5L36_0E00820 [Pichia kudriavzevii]AWU78015.1 hypothetical protein C5L36_0E00820 [Pichia kudriavzevii]ONH77626.1 Cytochrome c oxidase protein 20, mitochondrial [Pichia kudriavzevii]OUT22184.1 hypothetical protein CAS74_003175 [Pichia kudriavzevii]